LSTNFLSSICQADLEAVLQAIRDSIAKLRATIEIQDNVDVSRATQTQLSAPPANAKISWHVRCSSAGKCDNTPSLRSSPMNPITFSPVNNYFLVIARVGATGIDRSSNQYSLTFLLIGVQSHIRLKLCDAR
jgi:hypothetical protein